jgi:uncharacterized protein
MNIFMLIALILTVIWMVIVVVRFRRSTTVLLIGLMVVGLYTFILLAVGKISPDDLGLGIPNSWWITVGFALAGLAVMLAYSRVADWLATKWFKKPPTLEAFRGIQQSRAKLFAGIIVAWVLGGILEELIARGIVLQTIDSGLSTWLISPLASGIAICISALGAGILHLYQGPRAVVIITQLSVLFGILFIVSGHNLWTVVIFHGLYDTIAFIRFANKKSRYSGTGKAQG